MADIPGAVALNLIREWKGSRNLRNQYNNSFAEFKGAKLQAAQAPQVPITEQIDGILTLLDDMQQQGFFIQHSDQVVTMKKDSISKFSDLTYRLKCLKRNLRNEKN